MTDFSDRDGIIWFNGHFIDWRDAKLHVLNHALHYGSSVYEGIRIYDGVPFKLDEHIERLIYSAKKIGLSLPYSKEQLIETTLECVKLNNLTRGYIRPLAYRGSETMLISGEGTSINVAIAAWNSFDQKRNEGREKGYTLTYGSYRRPLAGCFPYDAKSAFIYTVATIMKNEALAKGYDDALLLDQNDYITESTTSNFFIIKDNELYTPIADCFLNGITRQTVIQLAKDLGITVYESKLTQADVANADAVFITGTAIEMMPITKIENQNFPIDHFIFTQLHNAYKDLTARYVASKS